MARWLQRSLLCAGAVLLGACAHARQAAIDGLMRDVEAATLRHDDVDLVTQAVPTYLLLLDGLLVGDPDNAEWLRAATEGYTSYGVLLEADAPERAGRAYARARDYGLAALAARRPAVAPLLHGPFSDFDRIDDRLRRSDVPYVFWAASAWGAWISTQTGSMAALADLPRVLHLMDWVVRQDEGFRHGSGHLFLGVYHAALPPLLGGDPEAARTHFERALELTDGHDLLVYVQMARFYARQVFDRELYVSLLQEALAAPTDTIPDLTLQNVAAQRLARRLLEDVDAVF